MTIVTYTDDFVNFGGDVETAPNGATMTRQITGVEAGTKGAPTLSFEIFGDFFDGPNPSNPAFAEAVSISIEGNAFGSFYTGNDYSSSVTFSNPPSLTQAQWAAVIADGTIDITYVFSIDVDDFTGLLGTQEYIKATFTWDANIAPSADTVGPVIGTEDQPGRIAVTLSGNDTDSGDAVDSFTIATLAANGQLFSASTGGTELTAGATITATGSGPYTATVYFQPDADWNGSTSFTYTASDGDASSTPATASIDVTAVTDIADDSVTVGEDSGGNSLDLLANDAFEDSGRAITAVGTASHGTVAIDDNGTSGDLTDDFVIYTLDPDFNGTDSFEYTVTSGGVTETATVSVTVTEVTDIADDSVTVGEDSGGNGLDLLANDTFEDSGRLITAVGTASHGTITIDDNGTASDLTDDFVVYTPDPDFNGIDQFTYTVTSGGVDETATVDVTVTAVDDVVDDALTITEDTSIKGNVLAGDGGANPDNFEDSGATVTSNTQAAHGVVTVASDGTFSYVPDADFNGVDQFTYTVTAGGVTETGTVDLTVDAVADIADDNPTTNEDTAVSIKVQDNDTFEGNPAISGFTSPSNGVVTLNNNGTAFTSDDFLVYTPDADFNGVDTFTYTVSSGGVTETATVNVTVNEVTDGVADTAITNEGTAVNIKVLDNDTFEGTPVITGANSGFRGTVTINDNGTADTTDDFLVYTPSGDFNGNDFFSYSVTSGGVTETVSVSVTINPVNDSPVLSNLGGSVTTTEQTQVLLDNDVQVSDVDLNFRDGSGQFGGTSLTLARQGGANAQDTFDFLTAGAQFTVVGNSLQAFGQTFATFTDAGGTLTISFGGAFQPTTFLVDDVLQHILYTNTSDAPPASLTLLYTFNDGSPANGQGTGAPATGTGIKTVNIIKTQDPATSSDDAFNITETTNLNGNLFANNGAGPDVDPDGDPFQITDINGIATNVGAQIVLPSGALLKVNADGTFNYNPNGILEYLPGPASGASNTTIFETFTYRITGGTLATVTIVVTGVDNNDRLSGTSGNDTLAGGALNDIYTINNTGDQIIEQAGRGVDLAGSSVTFTLNANVENLILTGTGNTNGTGNGLDNIIRGNAGINVLAGLGGNDNYAVQTAGDKVIEAANQGVDTVSSSVSFTLGPNVENLVLSGNDNLNGTGNELANTLTGNAGDNQLRGLGGNDVYVVQNAGDKAIEGADQGIDRVNSSVTFTLGGNIELLVLTGNGAINGTGNGLDNRLTGNGASNTLTGGNGSDGFVFETALSAHNIDRITDFSVPYDTIHLENAIFTGLANGWLAAGAFNTGSGATQADDRIIYNSATGALIFDSNGSAAGGAIQFATLSAGLALTNKDFFVM